MQKSKAIKIFALAGIALIFVSVSVFVSITIPRSARRWAGSYFTRYSSVIPISNWRKFSSVEGKFSIFFPGDPQCTNVAINVSGVDVSMPCYFVWNRQMEYAVNYSALPKSPKKLTTEQKYDICQAFVGRELGKIVFQKDIQIDGYPGREFEYEVVGKVNYSARVELVLVNDRLYQLIFVFLTGSPHPPDRDTFFNSFRLQN